MFSLSDSIGFLFILGLLGWVGFYKTQKTPEFLVANRSVGLFALVATLVMTEFNTSTLLAFSAAGYVSGPMAIGLPFVFLVGLSWYTVTVSRPWKRYNGLSVAGFFTQKYGPTLGKTASILLMLAMTGFSATYVKSMTLIFMPWFGMWGAWILSAVLCILVLFMTLTGGLLSIIRTDVFSFIITVILFPLLCILGWSHQGGIQALKQIYAENQLHPSLPFWFITTLIILTMFTYICSPWYGQKIFSAKNEKTAFWAVGISSCLVFLLYGTAVLAAAFYRLKSPQMPDPQMVIPSMIQAWLPVFFRGVAYAVLFAAAMTTLGGVWNTMVAMIVSDFNLQKLSVHTQRIFTFCLAIISWLGANLLVDNILNRLILANIPIAALSFSLLAGFHWAKVSRTGAWFSVIVGCTWGVGCFVIFGDAGGYTWYWSIYGIPLIFMSGILGSYLFPDQK